MGDEILAILVTQLAALRIQEENYQRDLAACEAEIKLVSGEMAAKKGRHVDGLKKWLEQRLVELKNQQSQHMANLNAVGGAIQLAEAALAAFNSPLAIVSDEPPGAEAPAEK